MRAPALLAAAVLLAASPAALAPAADVVGGAAFGLAALALAPGLQGWLAGLHHHARRQVADVLVHRLHKLSSTV